MYNFIVNKGNIFELWFSRQLQADPKWAYQQFLPPFFFFTFSPFSRNFSIVSKCVDVHHVENDVKYK